MEEKVSVIIPVYNRQEVVRECVQSILKQTYDNFEIILIDDGSADRTLAVCRELAEQDDRIRVLEAQHGGVSAARNLGIEAADGDFVFFVDSDDAIHPRLMETLVHGMSNSGAAMAGTNVVGILEENWHAVREHLKQHFEPGETTHQTNEQAVNAMLTRRSPLGCIGGVMMRRDLIGHTRFRSDLFIGEDHFFIYENLIKGAEVEFLERNWYYVRHHENNISWNYGYDGFYTRFLRRKLVWESEEALGRPENAKREKQGALYVFNLCLAKKQASKEERRNMRNTMKQHKKELFPAYKTKQKVTFYLNTYVPFGFISSALFKLSEYRSRRVRQKAKDRQRQQLRVRRQQDDGKNDVGHNGSVYSEHYELLNQFLRMPVSSGDAIFSVFEALPGAASGRGETDMERYVYVPGTRPDRVLLVAHADTVWDLAYKGQAVSDTQLVFEDGVFRNSASDHGIGADDRAGCAMLYALRDSGHSLLLVNGEEHGKKGVRYLRRHNKRLFKELNRHRYMIEFDWRGTNECLFNQVDYSNRFKKYIEETLGFLDSKKGGGCDLQVLCHKVCGVNIGVGYHNFHTAKETLCLNEWENTYKTMVQFLQKEQPRFPVGKGRRFMSNMKRLRMYAKAAVNKAKKLLHS